MTEARSPSENPRRDWWAPPCFSAGLALLVWTLYSLGKPFYAEVDVRKDLPKVENLGQARFVVLGASHAKGVTLDVPGLDGENLYHNGQDLFEVAYIARSVLARAPHLETVVITLSYFSFGFDNAAYERHGVRDRIGRRIDMYSAFPRLAFVPGDGNEYLKGLLYPVITRDHFRKGFLGTWQRALDFFGGETKRSRRRKRHEAPPPPAASVTSEPPEAAPDAPDDPAEPDDSEGQANDDVSPPASEPAPAPAPPKRKSHKTEVFYARHAAGRCRQYDGLLASMRAHHPNIEQDTYDELLGLIRELEAKHVSVVLVTPPYLPVYTACFDQRMQRLTRANGERLSRATKARYFDLSTEPSIVSSQALFMDSDHLRPRGREMVSEILVERLGLKRP